MEIYLEFGKLIVLIVGTAVAGFGIYKYFDEKKTRVIVERNSKLTEVYELFIELTLPIMQGLHDTTNEDHVQKLKEIQHKFFRKMALNATENIIFEINKLFDIIYEDYPNGKKHHYKNNPVLRQYTRVLILFREHLNIDEGGLGGDGEKLLRLILNDYHKQFN